MEYVNGKLCLGVNEMIQFMSASCLSKMTTRKQVKIARRACYGVTALYEVDSLPWRYRREVYKRYPDADEKEETMRFSDTITPDADAVAYYAAHVFEDARKGVRHLPEDKQEEYANNCALLNAFDRVIEIAERERLSQSATRLNRGEFWQRAAAALPRLGEQWRHSLPENARSLQRKYNQYKKEGYSAMISGKWQNKNATKVESALQEAALTTLCTNYNNLEDTRIAELYNRLAADERHGWEPISAGTVANWRKAHPMETAAGRKGAAKFNASHTMQVKRTKPTAPWMLWSLDGWTVELLYQKRHMRKNGTSVVTYTNRLTMVVVLDASCNYPMGYAIGENESPALIKEALRQAALHSRELTGDLLKACQIQSDNYAKKTMMPIYAKAGLRVTPAAVKNAKAKPVERYFRYLNDTYCKVCRNWSGYGITSNPDKQPNSEAKNALRKSFPDRDGLVQQIEAMMAAERAKKREELMEKYTLLPAKHRTIMTREEYLLAYGTEQPRTIRMESCGLRPTILGERRAYDSFDLSWREHPEVDWRVLYDPDDLSDVLAVTPDGTRRYLLEAKYEQPMALVEREEGDAAELERVFAFNRRMGDAVSARLIDAQKTIYKEIEGNERSRDLLGRLMLLDSKGQHKDERSRALALSAGSEDTTWEDIEPREAEPIKAPKKKLTAKDEDENNYDIFWRK